ncbi:MAG: lectin-like protein [Candidatus Limivivens sp.]|nr:lectin-like protein [Candidatus Limivivens sp.]
MRQGVQRASKVLMVVLLLAAAWIWPGVKADAAVPADAEEWRGHYYKIFPEEVSVSQAKKKCEEMGGYLLTVTSPAERDFVNSLRDANNSRYTALWVGAIKKSNRYTFSWMNGEECKEAFYSWNDSASAWFTCWYDSYAEEENGNLSWHGADDKSSFPMYHSLVRTDNRYASDIYLSSCGPNAWKVRHGFICEWGAPVDITSFSGKSFQLSEESFVYNGQAQTPRVTVCHNGDTASPLEANYDYSVKFVNSTNIGQAYAVISGIARYKGTIMIPYYIVPAKTWGVSVTSDKIGTATVTFDEVNMAQGYEIRYYKADNPKKVWTKNTSETSCTLKNLDQNAEYVFSVAAYRTSGTKKYYGEASSEVSRTIQADAFVKVKKTWYYRGGNFSKKTYNLDGPLVIDQSMTLPTKCKVTAEKITIKANVSMSGGSSLNSKGTFVVESGLNVGMKASLSSAKDFTVKGKLTLQKKASITAKQSFLVKGSGALAMGEDSTIYVEKTYYFSPTYSYGNYLNEGTVTVKGNVDLRKNHQSGGDYKIILDGSNGKTRTVNCAKDNTIACMTMTTCPISCVKLKGAGRIYNVSLGLGKTPGKYEFSKQFTISVAGKRDKAIDEAIRANLFAIMYGNAYAGRDILADFYDGMEGVAVYTKRNFSIPIAVKRGKTYEYGTLSGSMQGLGTLAFGPITYQSRSGKKYSVVCTPNLKTSNKAVKKFMSGLKKGAQAEIKSQVLDTLWGQLIGDLGTIFENVEFSGGVVTCKYLDYLKFTCKDLGDELEGWTKLCNYIQKK